MAKQKRPDYTRLDPNVPNRLKSSHSRGSGNSEYVRHRHPEYLRRDGDGAPGGDEMYLLDIPGSGDPEEGSVSKDVPCNPFADTRCYALDLFDRTFSGGTYSAGSSAGTYTHWKAISNGDSHCHIPDHSNPTPFALTGPDLNYFKDKEVWSSLGTGAIAHPWNPGCGCAGLDFTFVGWKEESVWHKVTLNAHPADMAGITYGPIIFRGNIGLAGGTVAYNAGGLLAVSTTEPTSVRDGTVIAALPTGVEKTIFIPAAYIPAEGEDLWIGILPAWQAHLGDYTCGFRWPWMDGKGNSGAAHYDEVPVVTFQTWDAAADDWGSGIDQSDTDSFFEGGLPWNVAVSGGTVGINGDALYLTVSPPVQQTLVATMPGVDGWGPDDDDDDGVYGEPWTSDFGVRMKARFRLTTAGSLTEDGSRYLKFEWHDGRQPVSVTVHLGDADYNQGLSVADEVSTAYTEKDITEGSWMWVSLDLRNPEYLRGKMWLEQGAFGSGEPPIYDVQVSMSDDSELPTEDNYFRISMQAGNETGDDQTIEVFGVWFCNGSDDCYWVEERIGQGDGTTTKYATSMAYKPGSLWFFVDGHHLRTVSDDYNQGTFYGVDYAAAADDAVLVARYRVDLNPDGD